MAAMASLYLTRGESGIAAIWPPSGILFAALFVTRRDRIAGHLIAAAIASLAANLLSGNGVLTSIGFTIANIAESAAGVWLLRNRANCRLSFTVPTGIGCFCKAAVIGPVIGAIMATAVTDQPSPAFWL